MRTKILLIEDEPDLADNITILLESNDFEVLSAKDGLEGVKCAQKFSPDLIICDILMPEMDGFEVFRTLEKDRRTSLIPFIFLTARTGYAEQRKGMNLGADDYLFKPFVAQELLDSIETRLKKLKSIKAKILKSESLNKKYKPGDSILFHINNAGSFVKIESIEYIYAERQYTAVVLNEGKKIMIRKALNKWEESLPENLFVRINRSVLINITYVDRIIKSPERNYTVTLKGNSKEFEISRRFVNKLKKYF